MSYSAVNADDLTGLAAATCDAIQSNNLDTIIVGGSDINGIFRGKRLPAERFIANPYEPVRFADYFIALDPSQHLIPPPPDFDGWWPDWSRGFGDIEAVPDLSTFRVAAWLPRTGVVLCDYRHIGGAPLVHTPRQVLRRVLEIAEQLGVVAKMGPELEFYLLRDDPADSRTRNSAEVRSMLPNSSVYGVLRGTLDEPVLQPLRHHLERSRISVDRCEPEGGPGQWEINLRYDDALEAADRAFLFKQALKEFSASKQLSVTFMAKPFSGEFGSSFHVHQSIWSILGDPLFLETSAPGGLSKAALHYIGGALDTLADFTCLFAPTVNSYKRLTPYSAAGTTATWGHENRTAGIRSVMGVEGLPRIELRTPGADANPYLVLAGALAGGLHGMKEEILPPGETRGDAYESRRHVLPHTLETAADAFAESAVAKEYFGEEFVRYFSHTRKWEARQFYSSVTDWEIGRYLNAG
ncbi:glutamine synthetase family protein [Streptomyces virginiae]|uniref:glutamine synthetase family protein n=1 Tax=Streptomyces virginiae TaxID=1961 RepID=UPI003678506F